MTISLSALMKQRGDTAANWTAANPTLLANELAYETDTQKWKVGDGATAWTSLGYTPWSQISSYPIVNADIAAGAEIAVSKLADGDARQLLQTDAAGTGVEWASNIDVPGTLDVAGAATFDSDVTIQGDLTVNGTETIINTQTLDVEDKNIVIGNVSTPSNVTADGGGITLLGSTNKTINWIDATDAWTSSERFDFPAGTEGVPSIILNGDVNSGIYQPGVDQVAISTGGTGRLLIDSSGRLLVGTSSSSVAGIAVFQGYPGGTSNQGIVYIQTGATNPTTNAHLANLKFSDAAGSVGAQILAKVESTWAAGDYPGRLEFYTTADGASSPTERMRIDSSGRVGVGTTTVNNLNKLHVRAASASLPSTSNQSVLLVENNNNTWVTIGSPASNFSGILFADPDDTDVGQVRYNHSSNSLEFVTNATERLRIDSSGRVGVGTSSPGSILHLSSSSNEYLRIQNTTAGNTVYLGNSSGTGILNADGANSFKIQTNSSDRLTITSAGNVGVGTTSPSQKLHLLESGATNVYTHWANNSNAFGAYAGLNATGSFVLSTNGQTVFETGSSYQERARIDSSGRLLVNTSTARSNFFSAVASAIQVEGNNTATSTVSVVRNSNDADGPTFLLGRSRGTGNTIVQSGDRIGRVEFQGNDGANFLSSANIQAFVDGTPGTNDMPGRLVFSTTADGASSPTGRMYIYNQGDIYTTCSSTTNASFTLKKGAASADSIDYLQCRSSSNAATMVVKGDGDLENANNSYTGFSDIKLKENIVDAKSQWDDIKALQVRNYNFKESTGYSTHRQIGVIAQELELVSPGLVKESIDTGNGPNGEREVDLGTTTKSVNYSVLYMKAVKALQEAMERIETLEAKVAALEAN